MFYHLKILPQIRRIVENCDLIRKNTTASTSNEKMQDVTDGLIYKSILQSDIGQLIREKRAFTMTINTDGISLSKKSHITVWPIYLCINEIPLDIRFAIENVIVAG